MRSGYGGWGYGGGGGAAAACGGGYAGGRWRGWAAGVGGHECEEGVVWRRVLCGVYFLESCQLITQLPKSAMWRNVSMASTVGMDLLSAA